LRSGTHWISAFSVDSLPEEISEIRNPASRKKQHPEKESHPKKTTTEGIHLPREESVAEEE